LGRRALKAFIRTIAEEIKELDSETASGHDDHKVLARAIAQELAQGSDMPVDEHCAYDELPDGTKLVRQPTGLEAEVLRRFQAATAFLEHLPARPPDGYEMYVPNQLKGALFVGHLVTDLDSIAGAIGAADLYDGIPCRASKLNSETLFAVEKWGVAVPPPIEDMVELHPEAGICLVDHQQTSQVNPAIPPTRIVGVIDHHALQSETIVTEMPIYLDVRPWGSMSTIIAHNYFTVGKRPPKAIAGMLLCAILSDTLNLAGPTTTTWDKMVVAILTKIAGIDDINFLASQQFKAKSRELAGMSAHQLVCGDQKVFTLKGQHFSGSLGFAVVETTDDEVIMAKKDELIPEILDVKSEKKLDFLFVAVVNIIAMRSTLLLASKGERALAKKAFSGPIAEDGLTMDLGSRVSRKKEFIPPLTAAVREFKMPPEESTLVVRRKASVLYVDPTDPTTRVQRRQSEQG